MYFNWSYDLSYDVFLSLKIVLILANSADTAEWTLTVYQVHYPYVPLYGFLVYKRLIDKISHLVLVLVEPLLLVYIKFGRRRSMSPLCTPY